MPTVASPPSNPRAPDGFPSGSFGIGVVEVQWALKQANEVDVTVSVLGVDIDTLTGTLNDQEFQISDQVNILGLVTGTLGLKAVYGDQGSNGLWLEGQLTTIGNMSTGPLNYRIIPW